MSLARSVESTRRPPSTHVSSPTERYGHVFTQRLQCAGLGSLRTDVVSKQQRHCFAPGCKTGYASARKQGKKASRFVVPVDNEGRRAWERAIPRPDKPLEKNCAVCEDHFDERFIVRRYKHVINGESANPP
ncbi:hypothetical protein HPB49_026087 [Dermacentor silvarum]|nr:hypothetical protein HPB49_026087 [Dermacentor silvarum]